MKSFVFYCFLLLALNSFSQTVPQKINYQAIARNSSGTTLNNQSISIKIEIVDSGLSIILYSERHAVTTNQFGLFSIQIGDGTVLSGSFSSINWSNQSGIRFISTYVDLTGGTNYQLMGTSQLLSVPYSLYSKDVPVIIYPTGDSIRIGSTKINLPGVSNANPPSTINTGLVAYYPFSGNASDSSGNNYNGTSYGATLTTDRFGNSNKAYSFNGTSNYIDLPVNNFAADFTIGFWFYSDTVKYYVVNANDTIGQKIISKFTNSASIPNGFELELTSKSKLGFGNGNVGGLDNDISNTKNWYYANLVYQSNTKTMYLYRNGILKSTSSNFILNTNNVSFRLGARANTPISTLDFFYKGKIDDVRFYSRMLSQSEITYLATN